MNTIPESIGSSESMRSVVLPRPEDWSRFRIGLLVLALVFCLHLAFMPWMVGHRLIQGLDNLILTGLKFSAGFLAFARARRDNVHTHAWRWFGAAFMLSGFGTVIWVVLQSGFGISLPFPSWADAALLCIIPTSAMALLSWPLAPEHARGRLRTALDGLVIACSVFFISWALILAPIFHAAHLSLMGKIVGLTYPMGLCVVLTILVFIGARNPSDFKGPFAFIGASILGLTIINLAFALLMLEGRYYTGHFLDLFWIPVFGLGGLAALCPHRTQSMLPLAKREQSPAWSSFLPLALPYFPGVASLIAVLFIFHRRPERMDLVLLWTGLILMLALLGRQVLAMLDIHDLSVTLDQKVRRRTERLKQLQDELSRAKRMQSLADMSAGVAHDFNNLIQLIQHGADQLELRLQTATADVIKHIAAIQSASDRAADMTRKLLASGRQQPMNIQTLHLNPLIVKLQNVLEEMLPENIVMKLKLSAEPLELESDPIQIEQVLLNLVSNARDAMPNGGAIKISTWLEDSGETLGLFACIEVADNGSGIPPEVIDRVFEPFFTTKELGRGTGLGLSTVWGIVTQSGGNIDLKSELGKGSTFTVKLPI
jgi:signal transduction histidine kinase